MLDPVPWFIGGQAEHSAETARMLAWNATQGRTGVAQLGDFAVRQTKTPSNKVRVYPGGGSIESTYAGANLQSYMVRSTRAVDVAVPTNTGSSAVTRYVGILVTDPQYAGDAPSDPKNGPYNEVVVVNSLRQSHPFLLLASIRQPAGVSVITNAMLTDRRELLAPRRAELVMPRPVLKGDIEGKTHVLNHKLNEKDLRAEQFPDAHAGGEWEFDVPSWASRMTVEAHISGVRYDGRRNSRGAWYVEFVGNDTNRRTQDFGWDVQGFSGVGKTNWLLAENIPVSRYHRGRNIKARFRAFIDNASSAERGVVSLDFRSGLLLKLTFHEVPDAEFVDAID